MPTARGFLTANVVNGKIYLIDGSPNTLIEIYDPALDLWTTGDSIPNQLGFHVLAVIDNKIYFISSSQLQIYNPLTDKWSQGTSSPYGGGYGAGVTTGDFAPERIYVISHNGPNGVYDPETDTWNVAEQLPTSRTNFGVAVVNDKIYAIGGHTYTYPYPGNYTPIAVNEQYKPLTISQSFHHGLPFHCWLQRLLQLLFTETD